MAASTVSGPRHMPTNTMKKVVMAWTNSPKGQLIDGEESIRGEESVQGQESVQGEESA